MATLRFTAAERPKLLARAAVDACDRTQGTGDADPLDELVELAQAFDGSDFKRFDELLSEHFRDVALKAAGLAPVPATPSKGSTEGTRHDRP